LAAGLLAFLALWATQDRYGYAIDEATYRYVAAEMRTWFAEIPDDGANGFSAERIAARWHFLEPPGSVTNRPHSNFNLPGSIYVLNFGWLVGHRWLAELYALRLGNGLLFLALVVLCTRVATRETGPVGGLFTALALVANPRLFGHAHLAATEMSLVAAWLGACLLAEKARTAETRRSLWLILFGLGLGLAFSVKLTAWLIAPPLGLWMLLERRRRGLSLLLPAVALPLFVVIAVTPNLWHDPFTGLWNYVKTARANPWQIPACYRGTVYQGGMPIESGAVTFLVTTPVAWLALALVAAGLGWRRPLVRLLLLQLAGVLAFRTAGLIPGHDGERQFIMAHGLVALLAGLGAGLLWERARRPVSKLFVGLALALAAAEPAVDGWTYRGHGLCYYNRLIGGLPGAAEAGMEVCYWLEAVPDAEWKRLLDPLPAGAKVFTRPDHPGLGELKAAGVWPRHVVETGKPEEADYHLLFARKASYWIPVPDGKLVPTGMGRVQASGPAVRELRFLGVRLAGLHAVR